MNLLWSIVSTLMVALCLPQQPDKFLTEPNHPVTIFEKPLSSTKKLIVTCENLPLVHTPKEVAEQEQIKRESPTSVLGDHLYAYSYVLRNLSIEMRQFGTTILQSLSVFSLLA